MDTCLPGIIRPERGVPLHSLHFLPVLAGNRDVANSLLTFPVPRLKRNRDTVGHRLGASEANARSDKA